MTCNKACFESKQAIKAEIKEKNKTCSPSCTLRPYLCGLCGSWHITSMSKSQARIRRQQQRKRDNQIADNKKGA